MPITDAIKPLMPDRKEELVGRKEVIELRVPEQYIKVEIPVEFKEVIRPKEVKEEELKEKIERLSKLLEPVAKATAVGIEKIGEAIKKLLEKSKEKKEIPAEEVRKVLEEAGIPVVTFEESEKRVEEKLKKAI